MRSKQRYTRRAVLSVAIGSLLVGTAACGPLRAIPPTATPIPSPTVLPSPTSVPSPTPTSGLRVRVEELISGGVQELTPVPTVTPHPAPDWPFLVRVSREGDAREVFAEATVIGGGWREFRVPADRYWVFLPAGSQKSSLDRTDGGAVVSLPDRTLAYAWSAAVVTFGSVVDVSLVYWYLEP